MHMCMMWFAYMCACVRVHIRMYVLVLSQVCPVHSDN